jgi:hypothetical protein
MRRVALEAYPGLLAREVLGNHQLQERRQSQTNPRASAGSARTAERFGARPNPTGSAPGGQQRLLGRLADDASGDALDATLCLMQAAWAQQQHEAGHPQYGLPPCDPLEGWIVTA